MTKVSNFFHVLMECEPSILSISQAEVVVKHTTDYNIRSIRFSAYEEDQLVACGRDSVRFYRLKAGQLRGVSVRLSAPDRRVSERGVYGSVDLRISMKLLVWDASV